MKCTHCNGTLKKKTAPYHVDRNGYHLILDTLPAWVCSQCGEPFFEEKEVDSIQEAVRGLDHQLSKLAKSA
ncbi:MAG: YgiT-type zinc finger protein [Ignavibacteriales bacterium]|nr:YgiT-type zinc finger protein [Ignavibacteriales bacterium]